MFLKDITVMNSPRIVEAEQHKSRFVDLLFIGHLLRRQYL